MEDQDKRTDTFMALQETESQARHEVQYLKTELLASISHELRSPLTAIKGYAATLLRYEQRISCEERREFLLAIKEASDRLADVIDSLLEVSELGTGRITIEKAPVNLTHLVREAVTVAEQRQAVIEGDGADFAAISSTHKHHTFDVRFEDGYGEPMREELIIQADQSRLREVLDLLLENATSYSQEGDCIQVLIRPALVPDNTEKHIANPQRMIVISVQGNRRDVPKKDTSHILEPSNLFDTELASEINGLGLGLAICRHIVELHGGRLWAENVGGKGSTLFISLPNK